MVAELLDMDADVALLLDAGRAILEALDNSALSEALPRPDEVPPQVAHPRAGVAT